MAPESQRHDVFISYSSKDKNVADAIVSDLENHGIKCWYAPRDVLPGEGWAAAITEAIQAANIFVLVYTEESNRSHQVTNEVTLAVSAGKTIIPFRLSKSDMNGTLEYYLSSVHWLDAIDPPLGHNIEILRDKITSILRIDGALPAGQPTLSDFAKTAIADTPPAAAGFSTAPGSAGYSTAPGSAGYSTAPGSAGSGSGAPSPRRIHRHRRRIQLWNRLKRHRKQMRVPRQMSRQTMRLQRTHSSRQPQMTRSRNPLPKLLPQRLLRDPQMKLLRDPQRTHRKQKPRSLQPSPSLLPTPAPKSRKSSPTR